MSHCLKDRSFVRLFATQIETKLAAVRAGSALPIARAYRCRPVRPAQRGLRLEICQGGSVARAVGRQSRRRRSDTPAGMRRLSQYAGRLSRPHAGRRRNRCPSRSRLKAMSSGESADALTATPGGRHHGRDRARRLPLRSGPGLRCRRRRNHGRVGFRRSHHGDWSR